MKKTVITIAALTLATSTGFAFDPKVEHDKNCVACHMVKHDATFYGRKDHKATNSTELRTWVSNCQLNFELNWWDEDVDAMTKYLNDTFYKFDAAGATNNVVDKTTEKVGGAVKVTTDAAKTAIKEAAPK